MDKPNAIGFAGEIIDAIEQAPVDAYIDSSDSSATGDESRATFNASRFVDVPDPSAKHRFATKPLGQIVYTITVEAKFVPWDD